MSAADDTDRFRDSSLNDAALRRVLSKTWAAPRGLVGFLSVTDHKVVARRYIVTAFLFLVLAGLSAVAMRLQLAQPESELVGPKRLL